MWILTIINKRSSETVSVWSNDTFSDDLFSMLDRDSALPPLPSILFNYRPESSTLYSGLTLNQYGVASP